MTSLRRPPGGDVADGRSPCVAAWMMAGTFIVSGILGSTSAFHPSLPGLCSVVLPTYSPILFDTRQRPLSPSSPHSTRHAATPPSTTSTTDYFIYISSFTVLFHRNLLFTAFFEKLNRTKVTDVCLHYSCSCMCTRTLRE